MSDYEPAKPSRCYKISFVPAGKRLPTKKRSKIQGILHLASDSPFPLCDKCAMHSGSCSQHNKQYDCFFENSFHSPNFVSPVEPPVCNVSCTTYKNGLQTPKSSKGGGFTCCVPLCYNNSKRNPELSFYVIPKDEKLRQIWLGKISRKDFKPSVAHRVCSAHFVGGKKTYMNNIPTIVPKTIKPSVTIPRKTLNSKGLKKEYIPVAKKSKLEQNDPPNAEQELQNEIDRLKKEMDNLKVQMSSKEKEYEQTVKHLQSEIQGHKFTIDRFKHNEMHFRFYTGFESYKLFTVLLDYLKPGANSLIYWGSNTNMEKIISPDCIKKGRPRTLSVEEEFFLTLCRLRCGFPIEDMSVRFNLSTSHISRILITWIDFLYSQ
ncbi:uncharacterized protein LOC130629250 [Hydractinia symbiolongicarpus]|uniref:uncharacterized protein LOC130629250 n=1 Tax=Hydractinia symbiolongicarpus TaxID=13093 RepID=UPI0025508F49|nr:uncharacterized protein LOC130629250 [Hydractinia symbiolongicarpus]